jgi:GTP-binding protein
MLDTIEIRIKAGAGGDGVVSFRKEKFVPFGGPDGGDGGHGGNVIMQADPGMFDLRSFRKNKLYLAGNGESGRGKNQHGRKGKDLELKVPVGTVAMEKTETLTVLADLQTAQQEAVVVKGGKGGLGNTHFASSTNQAPQMAQKGEEGEEKRIVLELRLIADVGIIGYPNAGKSTLLGAASAARPEIASYPFTTLEPLLGVVETGQKRFVMAEIPGLIEGAHLGRGLGHEFLRHSMRTKVLVNLIDGTSASPLDDMVKVNAELAQYDPLLGRKPQLVAVNKIDLPGVKERLAGIKKAFGQVGTRIFLISAATGKGVPQLMAETAKLLGEVASEVETAGIQVPQKVFHPQPRQGQVNVSREGETFIVDAPGLERIVARVDLNNPEVRWQLKRRLGRMGVSKALEKAGIRPGDKVRSGQYQWEW